MSTIKKTVIAAVCVALCTVFPMAFHAIPKAGLIYTPMHIPVLLCGLITGPVTGFICGLAGPLISSLLTGMPASAMLPSMMAELAVYGLLFLGAAAVSTAVFMKSQAFYGTDYFADVIYTTDSPAAVKRLWPLTGS